MALDASLSGKGTIESGEGARLARRIRRLAGCINVIWTGSKLTTIEWP
jgi:hypothetical protein